MTENSSPFQPPPLLTTPPGVRLEECYASARNPVTGLRALTDGRQRRNKGCSSDGASNRDADGFLNEDIRVGGPHLCSIPGVITQIPKDHPYYERLIRDIDLENDVLDIIQEANIDVVEPPVFGYRRSTPFPELEPYLTLFVLARRPTIDGTWLKTARKLHLHLAANGFPEMNVEFANKKMFQPWHFFRLEETDPIHAAWKKVNSSALSEIFFELGHAITGVACGRVGQSEDGAENPATLHVWAHANVDRDWRAAREAIVMILEQYHLPGVAVLIHRLGSHL
ncbi:uncharacterized protein BJX67DRAFT_379887 [Aspergillus lucknowensis]|uniref:Uncharacterized protein n=1 Tax=Aspergillus lucknowensis TaxID=176173 RepID=A0ABR4LVC8_9EURO